MVTCLLGGRYFYLGSYRFASQSQVVPEDISGTAINNRNNLREGWWWSYRWETQRARRMLDYERQFRFLYQLEAKYKHSDLFSLLYTECFQN